jgi:hypothetical protein
LSLQQALAKTKRLAVYFKNVGTKHKAIKQRAGQTFIAKDPRLVRKDKVGRDDKGDIFMQRSP